MEAYRLTGRIVKVIRLLNADTTETLGKRLGISRQHLINVENGSQKLGIKSTQNFMRIYGINREGIELLERHLLSNQ